MPCMFYMIGLDFVIFRKNYKFLLFVIFCFIINLIFCPHPAHSEIKTSINGSGLKIPRIVSLKNSLTFMRTGPGKEYPIKFEINQKAYPVKIVAEFNNFQYWIKDSFKFERCNIDVEGRLIFEKRTTGSGKVKIERNDNVSSSTSTLLPGAIL